MSSAATVCFARCCCICATHLLSEAALNNPNVSEEAKQHSRAVVEDLQESGEYEPQESLKNEGNVIGGHKVQYIFNCLLSTFLMILSGNS